MESNLNGLIIDGKVYQSNTSNPLCEECDLRELCTGEFGARVVWNINLCAALGANVDNDFNFRFSQELTDKLQEKRDE